MRAHRLPQLLLLISLIASASAAGPAWQRSFFFDKAQANFNIADFTCPSPKFCIAAGTVEQNEGRSYPYSVITHDGGVHWTFQKPSDYPVSLFFLNDANGWMVTNRGIWATGDGGETWKRIRSGRGYVRVFFTDPRHGWVAGARRLFEETSDGGLHWAGVPDAGSVPGTPADITFEYISFGDPLHGAVLGEVAGHSTPILPDWMDPQTARYKLPADGSVFAGRTLDGGRTWTWTNVASRQTLSMAAFPAADRCWMVFGPGSPTQPDSQVVQRYWEGSKNTDVYRLAGARISDLDTASDGSLMVAAVQLGGKLANAPVPGKVRILSGGDFSTLRDEDVDYRAVAGRIMLANTSSEWFAATDTGIILRRKP